MAYFNPADLKSTTYEDALAEILFIMSQREKDLAANDSTFTPNIQLNAQFSTGIFSFSGVLPANLYLSNDGKIQYDMTEYLPTPGSG